MSESQQPDCPRTGWRFTIRSILILTTIAATVLALGGQLFVEEFPSLLFTMLVLALASFGFIGLLVFLQCLVLRFLQRMKGDRINRRARESSG